MFGHDNQSQHHDDVQSSDDGAANDQGMTMPPVDDGSEDFTGAVQAPADVTPVAPAIIPTAEPAAAATTAPATPAATPANADHLLDLKQQALQQLTPLINHLEQNPEEKFRTTMMMIQASDNDALLSAAYDAALEIPDEKVRAQALLDIVNEINYFTHSSGSTPEA